jgi:hypothetical protein
MLGRQRPAKHFSASETKHTNSLQTVSEGDCYDIIIII